MIFIVLYFVAKIFSAHFLGFCSFLFLSLLPTNDICEMGEYFVGPYAFLYRVGERKSLITHYDVQLRFSFQKYIFH